MILDYMLKKIFIKRLYILFVFCSLGFIQAQQSLKGTVVIDFADAKANDIYILNKTQNIYTTTDIVGHFSIKADINDTIEFKGAFLQERNFIVNNWALNNSNLVIHMNMEKINLEELIVKPKLTGYIKKDVGTVPKDDKKEKLYASLGIDIRTLDIKPEEKQEPVLSSPLSLNVEALLKLTTGYYRKMKNLREYESYIKKINDVRDFIGKDFFTTYLNLPETEIEQFLVFVEGRNSIDFKSYYYAKNYLLMSKLLEEESKIYKARIKQRDFLMNRGKLNLN